MAADPVSAGQFLALGLGAAFTAGASTACRGSRAKHTRNSPGADIDFLVGVPARRDESPASLDDPSLTAAQRVPLRSQGESSAAVHLDQRLPTTIGPKSRRAPSLGRFHAAMPAARRARDRSARAVADFYLHAQAELWKWTDTKSMARESNHRPTHTVTHNIAFRAEPPARIDIPRTTQCEDSKEGQVMASACPRITGECCYPAIQALRTHHSPTATMQAVQC